MLLDFDLYLFFDFSNLIFNYYIGLSGVFNLISINYYLYFLIYLIR
jgi:hypothetical protein